MTTVFHDRIYRDTEELQEKKLHRTNQGSNFLGSSFSNRDNVRALIQIRRKRQPQHLKSYFSSRTNPSIVTSIAPVLLNWQNETS